MTSAHVSHWIMDDMAVVEIDCPPVNALAQPARVALLQAIIATDTDPRVKAIVDGIADSAADIDAIWCNGYGFPRRRGGPMFYADTLGLQSVVAGIERFGSQQDTRDWAPAELLMRLASRGKKFADYDNVRRDNLIRDTVTS